MGNYLPRNSVRAALYLEHKDTQPGDPAEYDFPLHCPDLRLKYLTINAISRGRLHFRQRELILKGVCVIAFVACSLCTSY